MDRPLRGVGVRTAHPAPRGAGCHAYRNRPWSQGPVGNRAVPLAVFWAISGPVGNP